MNTDRISDFEKYLKREIRKAVTELGKFDDDSSRIHVQKLVLAGLVDRFDYMIDKTILDNCREEKLVMAALGLKEFRSKTMTENELLRMLIGGDDLQAVLDEKIKQRLEKVICQRHSLKLAILLELCTGEDINALKKHLALTQLREKFAIKNFQEQALCRLGFVDMLIGFIAGGQV